MNIVRNQITQSTNNLLDLYMNEIDGNLEQVDNDLFKLEVGDNDLLGLEYPKGALDQKCDLPK